MSAAKKPAPPAAALRPGMKVTRAAALARAADIKTAYPDLWLRATSNIIAVTDPRSGHIFRATQSRRRTAAQIADKVVLPWTVSQDRGPRTFALVVATNRDESHLEGKGTVFQVAETHIRTCSDHLEQWRAAAEYFKIWYPSIMNLFGNGRIAIVTIPEPRTFHEPPSSAHYWINDDGSVKAIGKGEPKQ